MSETLGPNTVNMPFRREPVGPICRHIDPNLRSSLVSKVTVVKLSLLFRSSIREATAKRICDGDARESQGMRFAI
jgi:hypothetical protein